MTIILLLIAAIVALAADGGSQPLDTTACDEESDQDAGDHRDTGRWVA